MFVWQSNSIRIYLVVGMMWTLHFIKIPKWFPNAFKFSNHSPNQWFPTWSLAAGWNHMVKLVKPSCLGWRPSHWSQNIWGWSLGNGISLQDGHPQIKVILYLYLYICICKFVFVYLYLYLSWSNHGVMLKSLFSKCGSRDRSGSTKASVANANSYASPQTHQNTKRRLWGWPRNLCLTSL